MVSDGDLANFRSWLERQKIANHRSIGNIISRLRRASQFVDVKSQKAGDMLIFEMNKQAKFKQLTMTVRSQLRRAITLFKQFQTSI